MARVQLILFGLAILVLTAGGLPRGRPAEAAPCGPPSPTIPSIRLTKVVGGLDNPVYVTHAGDGSGRLFVVEQTGRILIVRDGRVVRPPFLSIRNRTDFGGERGLLSVAFHPNYENNGRFFVNYTQGPNLRSIIAEYHVSPNDPDLADPTETRLLTIPDPYGNHNGGLNMFGPDGMLYIGLGDGGSVGDPLNNGQRLDTLWGKVLRIDVDGATPYAVPPDNPFVGTPNARGEIWAYGLRNPWRYAFDRCDGRLFLADVGQSSWEEVDIITKGGNYGWRIMEGNHCFNPPEGCDPTGLTPPIAEYSHSLGCSVTGGYVYRGRRNPNLVGRYIFGDYCSGLIWALTETQPDQWDMTQLLDSSLAISSFGEDERGNVYVVDHNGVVYRVREQ